MLISGKVVEEKSMVESQRLHQDAREGIHEGLIKHGESGVVEWIETVLKRICSVEKSSLDQFLVDPVGLPVKAGHVPVREQSF